MEYSNCGKSWIWPRFPFCFSVLFQLYVVYSLNICIVTAKTKVVKGKEAEEKQRQKEENRRQEGLLKQKVTQVMECLVDKSGTTYNGTQSRTITGLPCQRWASQSPHAHHYQDASKFPDASLIDAQNYCRNPINSKGRPSRMRPFCYVKGRRPISQMCNLKMCPEGKTLKGSGFIHVQSKQKPELKWQKNTSIKIKCDFMYCLKKKHNKTPQPLVFFLPCVCWAEADKLRKMPVQECLTDKRGVRYRGTQSKTKRGFTCQRWDSQTPHKHSFRYDVVFPDASIKDAENFCRNPSGPNGSPSRKKPYCYVNQRRPFTDECDIPRCSAGRLIE